MELKCLARIKPPDGGWGWVIVFAVFLGPFVGSLCLKYGSRPVCFVGGCIGSIGFILASLSNSMGVFMLTFGIIVGIGIGMNYLPGHVITNNYFEKKRGIAGGIVCAGAGFGVFLLAPIFQILLTEYGWRGAMLIIAGIFMQLCVCSTLMRPLSTLSKGSDFKSKYLESSEHGENDPMLQADQKPEMIPVVNVNEDSCYKYSDSDISYIEQDNQRKYIIYNKNKDPLMRLNLTDRCYSERALSVNPKLTTQQAEITKISKSLQELPNPPITPAELTKSQFIEPVALIARSQQIAQDNQQAMQTKPDGHNNIKENLRTWRVISCDMSIFRNKSYIPLLLGGVFIQMGQFIPNTFVPEYCLNKGLDKNQISIIMAVYGAVNIFGRLSAGCLANIKTIDALWLCNVGMFMCGIGCALFSFCTTFTTLCIYSIGVGYFIGYFPPLQILIMVEYLGIDQLPSALGFLQMAKGPAALFGPPLAGLVYQYSKDYAMSLGFAAILFFLAAGIQSLVPISNLCSKIKKQNTDTVILVD